MDRLALSQLRNDDGMGLRGPRRIGCGAAGKRRRNAAVRIRRCGDRLGRGVVPCGALDDHETVAALAAMDWQRVVGDHDTRLGAKTRRRLKKLALRRKEAWTVLSD